MSRKKRAGGRKGQKTPAKVYREGPAPSPPRRASGGAPDRHAGRRDQQAENKPLGRKTRPGGRTINQLVSNSVGTRCCRSTATRITSLSTDFVNRDDPFHGQSARIATGESPSWRGSRNIVARRNNRRHEERRARRAAPAGSAESSRSQGVPAHFKSSRRRQGLLRTMLRLTFGVRARVADARTTSEALRVLHQSQQPCSAFRLAPLSTGRCASGVEKIDARFR